MPDVPPSSQLTEICTEEWTKSTKTDVSYSFVVTEDVRLVLQKEVP